ncbi:MAG: tRNA-dihydrouridine synthase family protein [Planctomycetota bacterium]|nr:MAG: tRNA-dihydrouridine synthase family protein [Planctomycetota bacterium]
MCPRRAICCLRETSILARDSQRCRVCFFHPCNFTHVGIIHLLCIGTIELDLPVVQAAMSGYSDWPMRAIARQLGAPYSICEVMIDSFVSSLKDRAKTRHHLLVTDNDHPVGAQLMGAEPSEFPPAAKKLVEAGFDVIDINFGCPAKKASGRCRGGFHLGQPSVAIEILQRVRDAVPSATPVTVKMRRGLDDTPQSRDNFFRIIESAFELGIAAVTVHGRTVEQKYVGPSRWDFLKEVRQLFPQRTLLGSGDLFTAADCVRMLRETGVDGVTAARGSIGNPWIFAQAAALLRGEPLPQPPRVYAQRDVICEHFRLAEQILPSDQVSKQLRKFCIHYSAWHPAAEAVRAAFIAVKNAADWHEVIACHYAIDQPGQFPADPGNSGQPLAVSCAEPVS